jgi:hypothetical protein
LKLKEKHKYWGAYKILTLYATKYPDEYISARSTVEELFKKEGYTGKKSGRAGGGERAERCVDG